MAVKQERLLRLLPTINRALSTTIGSNGEVYLDKDTFTLRLFDGRTKGGFALLRADLSNLAPGVIESKLQDSVSTIGTTDVPLGGTVTSLAGLTAVTSAAFNGPLTGAVTGNVTGNLTGNVTGNLTGAVTGNASTATTLQTSRNINGVAFNGSADITVTADAGTLTGTALKSTVVTSSLTSVGTLTNLTVTNPISGSVTGNAGTVTNGVYTNGTYANPSWITSLALSKIGLTTSLSFEYNYSNTPALKLKNFTANLDFTSTPRSSAMIVIASPGITSTDNVMVIPDTSYPTGRADEWEMDPISLSGVCTTDAVTIYAHSLQGPCQGIKRVRYVIY